MSWVEAKKFEQDGALRLRRDLDATLKPPVWPTGFTLRPITDTDVLDVYALLDEAFAGYSLDFSGWWTRLTKDDEFDPLLCFLVHGRSGDLVAIAQCWTSAYLKDLAVAPRARGQGLGEALLQHVFAAFRARNAAAVDLKVEADNARAIRLYRRVGMYPVPFAG